MSLEVPRPARQLIRAARRLDNIRRRCFADFAIGPTQRDALLLIHDSENISQADLARRLGCEPCVVTRLVKRLVVLGVVDRTPDRGSRARFALSLSRFGGAYLPEIADEHDELERIVSHQLDEAEARRFADLLSRTVSTLDHVLDLPPDAEFPPRIDWLNPKGP